MTLDDFRKSLTEAEPPAELTLALSGLWWDAKGDWDKEIGELSQTTSIESLSQTLEDRLPGT
jgi:hypothetical protein